MARIRSIPEHRIEAAKAAIARHVFPDSDTGCSVWTGCVQANGYARINFDGVSRYAHRLAYMAYHGPVNDKHDVCHSCDNRRCVNPKHLFSGTRKDNMKDCVNKGRQAKGPSHAELLSGELGPNAKLTQEKASAARRLYESGANASDIAILCDVDPSTIRNLATGRTWRNVA